LRLLALRNARTKRALDQTRAMLLFGSLVSLVVATVASWSVQRESKRRAHAEADLLQKVEQLIRSNAELENFTKIAAHDLQEPLRSVSSHLQLLSRRYKGRLDAEADQFIGFAVSGASRMKQLIQDLLAYAHIGATDQVLLATSSDDALQQASINLHGAIVESGALVTHDVLPEVMANPAQLIQLFQNLVGNAIKYQHPGTPRVHIAAVKHGAKRWIFAVTDNGLGIKPQYFEKIFGLFERLHGPEEFSGTGIGLPICKKIIELHDGDLSVESQFGHGSTFRFSLAGTE